MRNDVLDLTNANGLETYYGTNGSSVDYGKLAEQSAQITALLLANRKPKTQLEAEIKASCGRKPVLNIGGKKDKWERCKNNLLSIKREELLKQQQLINQPSKSDIDREKDDKIMGIPKTGFYVGLTVIVLVGGFVAYKFIKNRQAQAK